MKVEEIMLAKYIADRAKTAKGRVITIHVSHVAPTAEARGRIAYILTQLTRRNIGLVKVTNGKYLLYLDSELGRRAKERDILGVIEYFKVETTA